MNRLLTFFFAAVLIAGCAAQDAPTVPNAGQVGSDQSREISPGSFGQFPGMTSTYEPAQQRIIESHKTLEEPRMDPWQRLSDADLIGRDPNSIAIAYFNEPGRVRVQDLDSVSISETTSQSIPDFGKTNLASVYVMAGRDFQANGDWGGASQAYWAGLRQAGSGSGSREYREKIRESAYQHLSEIADERNQPRWAGMMRLCSHLAHSKSDEAAAQRRAVEQLKKNLQIAEAKVAAAKAQSDQAVSTQNGTAAVQGGIVVAQAVFTGILTQSPVAAVQSIDPTTVVQVASELATAQQESQAANDTYNKAMQELNQESASIDNYASMQPDEDQAIEQGRSFLAEQTSYYLVYAADPKPYFDALDGFASDKPQIQHALVSYESAETQPQKDRALLELGIQLKSYEFFVATHERRAVNRTKAAAEAPEFASIAPAQQTIDRNDSQALSVRTPAEDQASARKAYETGARPRVLAEADAQVDAILVAAERAKFASPTPATAGKTIRDVAVEAAGELLTRHTSMRSARLQSREIPRSSGRSASFTIGAWEFLKTTRKRSASTKERPRRVTLWPSTISA